MVMFIKSGLLIGQIPIVQFDLYSSFIEASFSFAEQPTSGRVPVFNDAGFLGIFTNCRILPDVAMAIASTYAHLQPLIIGVRLVFGLK